MSLLFTSELVMRKAKLAFAWPGGGAKKDEGRREGGGGRGKGRS